MRNTNCDKSRPKARLIVMKKEQVVDQKLSQLTSRFRLRLRSTEASSHSVARLFFADKNSVLRGLAFTFENNGGHRMVGRFGGQSRKTHAVGILLKGDFVAGNQESS